MTREKSRETFRPERLLAFSDGVFGVVITLLVIDLRLPETAIGSSDAALLQALLAMGPKLFVFTFTFVIIGIAWLAHHRKFSYVHRVDSGLLWINLIYLLTLCLVPFASSVLSEHGGRVAFVLYALVMLLVEALSAALSVYCLRVPFLATDLSPGRRQDMILAPGCAGGIFVISAGMALGNAVALAHWLLLSIFPIMVVLGVRGRRGASHEAA